MDLSKFNTDNLFDAATGLFAQLGIKLNSNTTSAMTLDSVLKENRGKAPIFDSVKEVYFLGIVDNSVFKQSLFENGYTLETGIDEADRNYDGLMIFAVDLDHRPTRTDLSALTRAFNRISKAMPVAVLAKYDVESEAVFSLAISERFKYSQTWREGEKVGKIILLKDIRSVKTHAGHLRILLDLKRTADVTNYAQLHTKWLKVLDTKELNKTFFQELANWYFWAVDEVEFPDDEEKNDEVRNATSVIRLITRLMFVWFLKEKGLVSEKLFDERYLKTVLNFKVDSTFYKAILQNLFFATLNSDMGTRKFIADASSGRNSQHFVHNVFRYKREFKKPDETLKELFDPIPFLNGGLFECLDKEVEADGGRTVRVRVDGFSDHSKNVLSVPDDLFFGAEDEIDLNEIYGTKNKRYKVRGLINILDSYKFTIAENTPLEEEIALDPELLGKVFENLLASYNPETKTTARKQTGSFYTPREIVNYMVDESLIAYLKQKLQTESEGFGYIAIGEDQATMFGNGARVQQKLEMPVSANRWQDKDEDLEVAIRQLFIYSDDANPFNETETEILIKAIDNCKILDPACGSGAFPMGILHRLVQLLGKLDPDNTKWKQWQKQKAIKETEKAFEIGNVKEREERLIEINKIFEKNSDDYGRKLFLIENCIYGVDIQPIAIQIAKLRFFISLIVDQKSNKDAKDNLGIRPLPNLETKFVAANTLIGLEAQGGLKPTKVNDLERELKLVRAKHFGARTRKKKEKYREKDKEIRLEIADLLRQGGIKADVADQIAEWNPYDQNASAGWFDAEYMFGIEKGFDIVIGNPPYLREKGNAQHFEPINKSAFGRAYHQGKMDYWFYFLHRSIDLSREKSTISFITPRYWINSIGASKLIKRIRETLDFHKIVDIGKLPVFESVAGHHMVAVYTKPKNNSTILFKKLENDIADINSTFETQNLVIQYFNNDLIYTADNQLSFGQTSVIGDNFTPLGDLYDTSIGVQESVDRISRKTHDASTRDDIYVNQGVFVLSIDELESLGLTDEEKEVAIKKYLDPNDVGKYRINFCEKYLIYSDKYVRRLIEAGKLPNLKTHLDNLKEFITSSNKPYGLHRPRESKYFNNPKIVFKGMFASNEFSLDSSNYFAGFSFSLIIQKTESYTLKFLLALLNSKFALDWFYKNAKHRGAGVDVGVIKLRTFPVINCTLEVQRAFENIVDEIMEAKKLDADTTKLESKIDEMVYQLYGLTDEEIAIVAGRNV